jgi:predicted dehydrogenase
MDPQEEWLKQGQPPTPQWGVDSRDGLLVAPESADVGAPLISHGCATLPGDYLAYYTGVYEALRGEGGNPVPVDGALAVMQLLETGMDSARQARWVKLKEAGGLRRKY